MSAYYTEGFIKEMAISKKDTSCQITIRLEPAAPYMFETKTGSGDGGRRLLFVDDIESPCEAKIVNMDNDFAVPKASVSNVLLLAKVNHCKVRVRVPGIPDECLHSEANNKEKKTQISVDSLTIV